MREADQEPLESSIPCMDYVRAVGQYAAALERLSTRTWIRRRNWDKTVFRTLVVDMMRHAPTVRDLAGTDWYRAHSEDMSHWPMYWRDTGETKMYHPIPSEPRFWSSCKPFPVPVREVLMRTPAWEIEWQGDLLPPVLLHPPQIADFVEAFELQGPWFLELSRLREYDGPGGATIVRPWVYNGPGQGFSFGPNI